MLLTRTRLCSYVQASRPGVPSPGGITQKRLLYCYACWRGWEERLPAAMEPERSERLVVGKGIGKGCACIASADAALA